MTRDTSHTLHTYLFAISSFIQFFHEISWGLYVLHLIVFTRFSRLYSFLHFLTCLEQAKLILNLSPRQLKKQITFSDQIDTSFVISYVKCNPVLFGKRCIVISDFCLVNIRELASQK